MINLAIDFTSTSAIGYPLLFGGVLLGSVIPIVPTGAVVGAGAAVAMTTTGMSLLLVLLLSSALALGEEEIFFRRIARRSGTPELTHDLPPGVIFLQVDGLGYDVVRRAVRDGDMPTLAAWINEDSPTLEMWQCDWSSQTGAAVSGILHGDNHDILGFRWYEKDRDHVMACAHPRDAAEIERRHSNGKGLLSGGGAGHGNLFTGDADHVTLTMSAVPLLGTDMASPFEPHVGSHGGMGGPQARGFLVYPKEFRPAGEIVGAEALHKVFRGWLSDLGHPDPAEQETKVSDPVPLP